MKKHADMIRITGWITEGLTPLDSHSVDDRQSRGKGEEKTRVRKEQTEGRERERR